MSLTSASFRAIMGCFPGGVAVVTTLDASGAPRGLTLSATCSVSVEPAILLICVDKKSNTLCALRDSRRFVTNFLRAGESETALKFASKSLDKFDDVDWTTTSMGLPLLKSQSLAYAECEVIQEVDAGDHVVFLGSVVAGAVSSSDEQPLLYFRRQFDTWPVLASA